MRKTITQGFAIKACITALLLVAYMRPCYESGFFTLHLFHTNIWHLFSNLMALWVLPIRWARLFSAYLIAVLCAVLTIHEPTIGFSGVLFAYVGLLYGECHAVKPMGKALMIAALTGVCCDVAMLFHLTTLITGYVAGEIYRRRGR